MASEVEVDESPEHPNIVFFQDSETRVTVALHKATGRLIGEYPKGTVSLGSADNDPPVVEAAWKYAREAYTMHLAKHGVIPAIVAEAMVKYYRGDA